MDDDMLVDILRGWAHKVTGVVVSPADCYILLPMLRHFGLQIVPTDEARARTAETIRAIMLSDEEILAQMGYVKREEWSAGPQQQPGE